MSALSWDEIKKIRPNPPFPAPMEGKGPEWPDRHPKRYSAPKLALTSHKAARRTPVDPDGRASWVRIGRANRRKVIRAIERVTL